MSIQFLDPTQAAGADLPVADAYAHPAYGLSAALVDDGHWEVAVDGAAGICFPFVRRPVPGQPGLFDIVSPYGYGGLSHRAGTSVAAQRRFRSALLRDLRDRGCVAEFLRLNPLDGHSAVIDSVDTVTDHPTYGVVVTDPDTVAATTSCAHRTAVRRALRSGLTVEEVDPATLRDPRSPFRLIYAETMARVGAREHLRVGNEYFGRLLDLPAGGVRLLHACHEGRTLAAAVFLVWGRRVHYHLSGSTLEGRDRQATDLLLDRAMTVLTPAGGILHLGGGLAADDALSGFKRRASNTRYTTRLTRLVVDPIRYRRLAGATPSGDYFPAYRAPGAVSGLRAVRRPA